MNNQAAAPLPVSIIDTMIRGMTNPKLDKSLRALVVIDRGTVSSVDLANALNVSRPTAVRLVESLRELGCTIASERDGHDYWYRLADWGVFSPARVRTYVKALNE